MSIRTDLALELKNHISNVTGVISKEKSYDYNTVVTDVEIINEIGQRTIGKPMGTYITIDCQQLKDRNMDIDQFICEKIQENVKKMLPKKNDFTTLVVGLGNRDITADALGTGVVEKLFVTRHIREYLPNEINDRVRSVCSITPGVLGVTGIESGDIIKSITQKINPDVVILIDSLASQAVSRIGTTIQITDAGICPGSGVGNRRIELNEKTLNTKVIAIGVPMVVHCSTILNDLMINLFENCNMNSNQVKDVMEEVLTKQDMVVTPKEIDILINDISNVIARALNSCLHRGITDDEVQEFMY